jgi:hypothetical protein
MPILIRKRLSKKTMRKVKEYMKDPILGKYKGIEFNPWTKKFYFSATRKGELQTLGDRTKVSKVWDEEGYRESATLRRFAKPHEITGGDKPAKTVTKSYGEKGRFREKRVLKPQVKAKTGKST